ncbi:hypothetical protein [Stenotrophomonas sp.]|uniref:hypothetical protein n=1 Tax=Stenotrophomonas sp. TaxID=69392 RepID=UPI0028972BFF|nr:hypothetical protein [Stenotrophomonas sp.]
MGGEFNAPALTALPTGLSPRVLELRYTYSDLKPINGAPFRVQFDNGTCAEGTLDEQGVARVHNPPGPGQLFLGYDQSDVVARHPRPANPLFGSVPASAEEACASLAQYAQAEDDYMEDNFFPDEVAASSADDVPYEDRLDSYAYDEDLPVSIDGRNDPGQHAEVILPESLSGGSNA